LTIAVAWERPLARYSETVFCPDSRLSGGGNIDVCQKIFPCHVRTARSGFAGVRFSPNRQTGMKSEAGAAAIMFSPALDRARRDAQRWPAVTPHCYGQSARLPNAFPPWPTFLRGGMTVLQDDQLVTRAAETAYGKLEMARPTG
jgi:hypothetical protein